MDRLPELTEKQLGALLVFHRAWHLRDQGDHQISYIKSAAVLGGRAQAIAGAVSNWSFGSTTIATLKRLGLIVSYRDGYRITDEALALLPDPPRD